MAGTPFHRLPRTEAGCGMPSSASIEAQDRNNSTYAEMANERFVIALHRYGARHGLPGGLSAEDCTKWLRDRWAI